MKSFNLPAASRLKLTKTTPRKEIHGEAHVQAISLRLRWETSNEHLSLLHAGLKDMLFHRTPAVEAQALIEGVDAITPNLRVPDVALPLKLTIDFSGYTLTIEHGIDEDSQLQLYVCSLDKFAVDAKEGGSVYIDWSVASNKEITPDLVGLLCSLEGEEIIATLTPPAIATGDLIDGSAEAFRADHPDMSDDKDAGDLFAEAQGDFDDDVDEDFQPIPLPVATQQPRNNPVRYRNAATGETWSGRGLMPKWLKACVEGGQTLAEFDVSKGAQQAAVIE